MKPIYLLVTLTLVLTSCMQPASKIQILPEPVVVTPKNGFYAMQAEVASNPENSNLWKGQIETVVTEELPEVLGKEGYQLLVEKTGITLKARSETGIFYAMQSLKQLIHAAAPGGVTDQPVKIQCLEITDHPRFSWRGYMLDISRHFFPKDDILRMIDRMAMLKLNVFHLHILDDQGWRIEIMKYPELTRTGAWRVDREDTHWNAWEKPRPGETATYGGFLSQDEIREIVQYAADRHITVVPEIEMPAHVSSAIAAYPWLSCSGRQIAVPSGGVWPITDIYCAGKESTFEFLEEVLEEVLALFPSKYIHIGGDEATKTEWEQCVHCQARIRSEGLNNTEELQSYFIKRIEGFLNQHERILIGWDEILEGGLAPNAAVMSWRGVQGGIEAAKAGHPVVMTPTSHCYFDYYQGAPELEPLAIGGYLPLEKVYAFEPVPEELTEEEGTLILGAQANLWTEYVKDLGHAEYMTFPRLIALAEVVWSPASKRDYNRFIQALPLFLGQLEKLNVNYSRSFAQVRAETILDPDDFTFRVHLICDYPPATIRYTLDGCDPQPDSPVYNEPLVLNTTTTIRAAAFVNGEQFSSITTEKVWVHLGSGKPIEYLSQFSPNYPGGGENALTNSLRGSLNHADGFWQGFEGNDLEVIIDLGTEMDINSFSAGFMQSPGSWIFFPLSVEFAISSDGSAFTLAGEVDNPISPKERERMIHDFLMVTDPLQARFVKVTAKNMGICPNWHAGAGGKAWIFADEITIQ